jgi:AraC-like DNA-binding protein
MSNDAKDPSNLPPISTLLTPAERPRVDAAGVGCYQTLHRDTVEDLIHDLKSRHVHAVLVSVSCAAPFATRVALLVREFPRVPAVALLSEFESRTPHAVLALGQSGIRRLVDVRHSAGWRELRGALMADSSEGGQRSILGQLGVDLAGAPDDCWRFFEALFLCPSRIGTVRKLARYLDVLPSTMMSRFFRAGVPAPKRYLAMSRLVRAARLFENSGFSIANVAYHLDFSSPQSFGRHVRTLLHMTAGDFRHHYDGLGMFERFRQELVLPYVWPLRSLRPLTAPPGWVAAKPGHRRSRGVARQIPSATIRR